jgi:hypothetical protein
LPFPRHGFQFLDSFERPEACSKRSAAFAQHGMPQVSVKKACFASQSVMLVQSDGKSKAPSG